MAEIHSFPGPQDKLAGSVEAMKRAMPAYTEYLRVKAKMQRAHYLALMGQGFSAAEALYIIAHGENAKT